MRFRVAIIALLALFAAEAASAQASAQTSNVPAPASPKNVLGPPTDDGPVAVTASFEVNEISAINDETETFEFTGVLTLKWRDARQAFDPAEAGVKEKIYQGEYQFNELSPSWFPQMVLVNSAGPLESQGVVLKGQPGGDQTLIQKISGVAKTELDLHRFPFDKQSLKAVFEVLGFDEREVVLKVDPDADGSAVSRIWIPQWIVAGGGMSIDDRPASYGEGQHATSVFVTSIDVLRDPFYVSRLVTLPLIVIVLLSFSVFWMDRSSLGDRINVSFIGILTAVAYQVVMSEILPRIAYVTWMNAFLNFSFLMMVGTVVVNLVVGTLDQRGKVALGDLIDRRCRWIFPATYFSLIVIAFAVAFLVF